MNFTGTIDTNNPLRVDHFQQNGNIKITPSDSSNNENTINLESYNKTTPDKATETSTIGQIVDSRVDLIVTSHTTEETKNQEKNPEAPKEEDEEAEESYSLCRYPCGKSCMKQILWIITWPIHLVFFFTIPDCESPRFKKLFPLTFTMCIVWIGSLSYMVAWMITIIGKYRSYFISEYGLSWSRWSA